MLNSSERETFIELYYSQGKNVREISQEARMSFRDIDAILKNKEVSDGDGGNVICDGDNNNNKSSKEKLLKLALTLY
jgi:hypothetical protein